LTFAGLAPRNEMAAARRRTSAAVGVSTTARPGTVQGETSIRDDRKELTMAPTPFRRRGKLAKAARTARNVAIADAALALAQDRLGGRSHGGGGRRRGRTLLLGGVAVAMAAGVLWKRDRVAGLLPSRSETPEPQTPSTPPGPSNYDAPGPVANTATPVPAPEPQSHPAIDEAAEEAAAAAEAANIGGQVSDYAGPEDQLASEAERPLAEAGQGESEGLEQAELALEEAAQPTAPGMSDTERQIEDTIEAAANPALGEQVEPVAPPEEPPEDRTAWAPPTSEPAAGEPTPFESAADETTAAETIPPAGDEETPAEESGGDKKSEDDESDDGGSDWRTWSGRSINP
jgi:hypothetical protein